ncbi:hypothetical protein [Streptomyces aureus]|uniref:Uncharacterized protein n=1 Tax=Streptomyces aureus TaxID=193461 RepID=A0ABV4SQH7_9ACTN
MGRIGAAVARRAHFGFGMPVLYYDAAEAVSDHGVPAAQRLDASKKCCARPTWSPCTCREEAGPAT